MGTPTQEMNDDSSTKFYLGLQPIWSFPNHRDLQLKLFEILGSQYINLGAIQPSGSKRFCAVPIRVFLGWKAKSEHPKRGHGPTLQQNSGNTKLRPSG